MSSPLHTRQESANHDSLARQGNTGILDGASKAQLDSEFGTSNEDDVIKQILEKGHIIESVVSPHRKRIGGLYGMENAG